MIFPDRAPEFFSLMVDMSIIKLWQSHGSQQCIMQGELFPVVVSKCVWQKEMTDPRCISFIDNDSAREALVRSFSMNMFSRMLLLHSVVSDSKSRCTFWYTRVPSSGNPGDEPSRVPLSLGASQIASMSMFPLMAKLGARKVVPSKWTVERLIGLDVSKELANRPR